MGRHTPFADIDNKNDVNAYVDRLKKNEKTREKFKEDVNVCIRQFSLCRALHDFYDKVDLNTLRKWQEDLKRFIEIKKTTMLACAEIVDFSKYKDQIAKLPDKYVTAAEAEILSKEINLSDVREFDQYIEDEKNGLSDKSKADAILAQTKKIIYEKYDQDKVFYGKFSDLVERLLIDLKTAKKEDLASLLNQAKSCQAAVADYVDSDIPEALQHDKTAQINADFQKWLLRRAEDVFAERLRECLKSFPDLPTPVLKIRIKETLGKLFEKARNHLESRLD